MPISNMDNNTSHSKDGKEKDRGPIVGMRYIQTFLLFFLTAVISAIRYSVSVAIIAMTDATTSSNPDIKTYDWNNKSVILSSFYWGYILLQLFAAELSRFWGAKLLLITSMLVNCVMLMLIPLVADHYGSYGMIVCRVVQGLFQGAFFPSIYTLLGKWAPTEERSLLIAVTSSGNIIGIIITMPVTAFICASSYGWPAVYYLFGVLGLIWIVVFFIFGSNSPETCNNISVAERNYIENSLEKKDDNKVIKLAPWRDILTSGPVLAVTIAQVGLRWVEITTLTEMPIYMNGVLGFDLQSNGLLSSVPYVVSLFVMLSIGSISDYIINNGYLTRLQTRKLFGTISTTGIACAMLCLSFAPQSRAMSLSMLMLSVGMDAVSYGGAVPNVIDLSPNYSGIIMSICNATANISSIVSPLLVQMIVTDDTVRTQWSVVFCTGALIVTLSNVFYLFFASTDVQPWNDSEIVDGCSENNEKGLGSRNG